MVVLLDRLPMHMSAAKPYLLMADDDVEDQAIFSERFRYYFPDGMVHCVCDGQDLLQFLDSCPAEGLPRLVVLDYHMPIMNGLEVLKAMRERPHLATIRVVVWSTSNREKDRQDCMEWGASRYFVKPASLEELDSMIGYILGVYASSGREVTP